MGTTKPHEHDHHHDHSHGVAPDADKKYLTIALLLLLGFMAVEVVVGILAVTMLLSVRTANVPAKGQKA